MLPERIVERQGRKTRRPLAQDQFSGEPILKRVSLPRDAVMKGESVIIQLKRSKRCDCERPAHENRPVRLCGSHLQGHETSSVKVVR